MTSLDAQHHVRVKEIFGQVVDLPPDQASMVLDLLCGEDADLRADVESLLDHAAAPRVDVRPGATAIRAAIELAGGRGSAHGCDDGAPLPTSIGEFTILGLLGRGGMGIVYLAEQSQPRRTVALKVIRPGLDAGFAAGVGAGVWAGVGGNGANRMVLRRFRREAELLARVSHPNIAQIYAAGTADVATPTGTVAVPYFAMEYVKGAAISDHCRSHGLGVRERVALMGTVCDAVEHAHRAGILHRDLKPANVLVDERGEPHVLDFGIARSTANDALTATLGTELNELVGTLPYMSPEQCSGRPEAIDRRSDIYALGVMLYELLARRLPLDLSQRTVVEAVRIVAEEEPRSLSSIDRSLRGDLDTIVGKCLEKDPERRYQTADQLRMDLLRYLDDRPIEARPPSTLYQLQKFARRNRSLVAGVLVAFVAMIAATAGSLWFALDATAARHEAEAQLGRANVETARSTESFRILSDIILGANPDHGGGRDVTVLEMLDRSAAGLESLESDQPQVASMVLRLVASTFAHYEQHEKAERLLRRSIELHRSSDWKDDQFLVWSLWDLSNSLRHLGRYDEAIVPIREAIERTRVASEEDRPAHDPSNLISDLGFLFLTKGDHGPAVKKFREALAIKEALGGTGSSNWAIMLSNLGCALMRMDRLEEAEAALRESLAVHMHLYGEPHRPTLQCMTNLGLTLARQGRCPEALAMLERVLEVRAELLDPADRHRLVSEANVALIRTMCGDAEGAESLARSALEGRISLLGAAHPDTARSRHVLALSLMSRGAYVEARRLLEECLVAMTRTLADRHWMVVEARLALARLTREEGDPRGALAHAETALMTLDRSDSETLFASALVERALAEWACGDIAAAERGLRDAHTRRRRLLGEAHPDVAQAARLMRELMREVAAAGEN